MPVWSWVLQIRPDGELAPLCKASASIDESFGHVRKSNAQSSQRFLAHRAARRSAHRDDPAGDPDSIRHFRETLGQLRGVRIELAADRGGDSFVLVLAPL